MNDIDLRITDLTRGQGYLLGTVLLLGAYHHAEFLEVGEDAEGCQVALGDEDNQARYDDLQNMYDGCYQTVELPEYPGRKWVMRIFPHAD